MTETNGTKCLAVDDHPAVRQGLASLLAGAEGVDLVGSVDRGEAVIAAIDHYQPSVVIMDVRLAGVDGISVTKQIAERTPGVKTVVFSAYGQERPISEAIAAGALGYVMKGSPPDDLLRAIRTVNAGGAFIDPSLSPVLLMGRWAADPPLSERKREILQLLADGLHTEEAAERIGLSPGTVKAEIKQAIMGLGANGRVHAAAIALRRMLIE